MLACLVLTACLHLRAQAFPDIGSQERVEWHVLSQGAVVGCALVESPPLQFPKDIGRPDGSKGYMVGRLNFIVELPRGAEPEDDIADPSMVIARVISPDGDESQLRFSGQWKARNLRMIALPEDYRPDCPYLDVRIDVPARKSSIFRFTNLPKTRDYTAGIQLVQQMQLGPVKVEGVGFYAPPADESSMQSIGAAVRAVSLPEDQKWEWRKVQVFRPFGLGDREIPSGWRPFTPAASGLPEGEQRTEPLARQVRTLHISGSLERYVDYEEDLDFGVVPIRKSPSIFRDSYQLAIDQPISRTTNRGFSLSLMPDVRNKVGWQRALVVKFRINSPMDVGVPTPGPGRLAVDNGQGRFWEVDFEPIASNVEPSEYGIFLSIPPGATEIPLRIKIQRKIYVEQHSFDLYVPVQRLGPEYSMRTHTLVPFAASVPRWPGEH